MHHGTQGTGDGDAEVPYDIHNDTSYHFKQPWVQNTSKHTATNSRAR